MTEHVHDNIENKKFINSDNDTAESIINVSQYVKFHFYFTEEKMFKKLFVN